jgi:hypothetical protein
MIRTENDHQEIDDQLIKVAILREENEGGNARHIGTVIFMI